MESINLMDRKAERGFTLVELAIVMIIIGLLIGGILKGQELIANARVASTVAQIKGIDAATTTFRDKYDSMPGDMGVANTRIVGCAGACIVAGATVGNTRIDSSFAALPAAEGIAYWLQLAAADLLTGINPNAAPPNTFGGNFPQAEIGGGYHADYAAAAGELTSGQFTAANFRSGHYLALHNTPGGGVAATGILTPNHAFRIDNKLDDGTPTAGTVLAAGAAGCVQVNTYNEDNDVQDCNIYIRFQQ